MARQATRLRALRALPGAPVSLTRPVSVAAAVTPYLSTNSGRRSPEILRDIVLRDMADGRIFLGQQAVSAGLADGRASLQELQGKLANGSMTRRRPAAASAMARTADPIAITEEFAALGAQAQRVPPTHDHLKTKWNADAAIRADFGNDFEAFAAWERIVAAGRVDNHKE